MTLIASNPVAIDYSATAGFTRIWSINDHDEVAGGTTYGGAIWQNGQTVFRMGAPGGDTSGAATAANSQGQVVGYSSAGNVYSAVLWQNGVVSQISGLGANNQVYDINDQGIVVGAGEDSNGLKVAIEIINGKVSQLGVLPGGYLSISNLADSEALSINALGQVVGLSLTASGVQHAVLWQNGGITDLGSITGGGSSLAYKINDKGVIVGYAVDANGIDQAVVWQNGAMTVLPDHQSNGHSIAYGINNAGIIVGRSDVYTRSGGWQQDAVLWQNGVLIDLNSLLPENSGWVLNVAYSINNNGEIAGIGTYKGMSTGFVMSIGDSSGPMISASAAQQSFQATPHGAALRVIDSAANVQADMNELQAIASVGKLIQIQLSDTGTPVLTLTSGQLAADGDALAALSGNYALHITEETVSQASAELGKPHVTAVSVADASNIIQDSLDQLQSWVAAGQVTDISVTNQGSGPPQLLVSAHQADTDTLALKAISGLQLGITGATVAEALALNAKYALNSVGVVDTIDAALAGATQLQAMGVSYWLVLSGTAADLQTHFDALATPGRGVPIPQVAVTDSNFPTVSITATQFSEDAVFTGGLRGNFLLSVDASNQGNFAIYAAPQVAATVVVFPGAAADYSVSAYGGDLTVAGHGVSGDLQRGVTAVQFANGTDFIVQAPSATGETSGNVAALYAAVLARTPDVKGLGYYEHQIWGGQAPSLLQLAEDFLASPEYANNPSHAYAQSAAGDAQFIADTYQNLLHRAPESGAVPYYQAMLAQNTSGLTPGTAAYAAASTQAHAQLLVNFSASGEFLNDVQITAQHPQDAQHWLYVI